jgi:hypothetical protein
MSLLTSINNLVRYGRGNFDISYIIFRVLNVPPISSTSERAGWFTSSRQNRFGSFEKKTGWHSATRGSWEPGVELLRANCFISLCEFARFASNIIESQSYEHPNPEFLLIMDKCCWIYTPFDCNTFSGKSHYGLKTRPYISNGFSKGKICVSSTKIEIISIQTESFFTLTDTSKSNIGMF